jgi:hypothetical protein
MADSLKTVVTFMTLILFLVATGVTIYGIFKSNELSEKQLDERAIIPSQVLNGLTVMFLLYLTATNTTFSPSYKLLIIFLLVGGMIIEIYLTSYADREAESIAAYMFVVMNFLIRAFFLIDLAQNEWLAPIKPIQKAVKASVMKPLEQAIKEVSKPVTEAVSKPQVSEAVEDAGKELISKWDKLKNVIRSKPEGLNEESTKEAWKSIIRPAKDEGRKDIKEVLKEAVGKLKDKDGNPIPLNSVDAIGGSKRS